MWLKNLHRSPRATYTRPRPSPIRLGFEPLEDRVTPAFTALAPQTGFGSLAADMNADGARDLVSWSSVQMGNGDGTFQSPQVIYQGPSALLAVSDFNQDGAVDRLMAGVSGVELHAGNGDGTFDPPAVLFYDSWSAPLDVKIGDLDSNGTNDLVILFYAADVESSAAWCSVVLSNGNGTYQTVPYAAYAGHDSGTTLGLSDLNGDGHLDLVFGAQAHSPTTVHLGLGNGYFGAPVAYFGMGAVGVADVNNDGTPDVSVNRGSAFGNEIWLGNGDGTFYGSVVNPGGPGGDLVDINNDGRMDLLSSTDEGVIVTLGNGNGTFQSPLSFALGNSIMGIVADFNGDGFPDLVRASNPNELTVYLNDGEWGDLALSPSIAINNVTVVEGNTGTQLVSLNVSLSKASTQSVTAAFATADGTATAGFDYQPVSGTLTFAPGETTQTITVPVVGDSAVEPNETFVVNLSSPTNAYIADFQGVVSIVNDDTLVSVNDVTLAEGNFGWNVFTFTVSLSAPSDSTVIVSVETSGGTATPYEEWAYQVIHDYFPIPTQSLVFAPGETTKTINVYVEGDTIPEEDETFYVNLSNPTNAAVADAQGVGTILNDDAAPLPSISIGDASVAEGNGGTKSMTYTVTLSATSSQPVTVKYATANGDATAGSDYQSASGTVTFNPGETAKTITVPVSGDRTPESNETFVVSLSNPTYASIADGQGVGTIIDDEPRVGISDVTRSEGRKGKTTLFTFTVSLSVAYDQPVTMSFRTADGTAKTSNSDYVAKTGTITFAPGETTKTITIRVKGDSKRESNEYFYLDLFGNSSNSVFSKNRGVGTILNDD